jgi:hypothetical protein
MNNPTDVAAGVIGVPVIVALVALLRQADPNSDRSARWAPFAALLLGMGAVLAYTAVAPGDHSGLAWYQAIAQGLGEGLAAAGLYSGAKAAMGIASTRTGRPAYPRRE